MTTGSDQITGEPPAAGSAADTLVGDPDWEWHSAAGDSPEELMALWRDAVARSRTLLADALADGGLDRPAQLTWPDGRTASLRRLLIDLIEDCARHTGHADLIRESIDGLVGEDPGEHQDGAGTGNSGASG